MPKKARVLSGELKLAAVHRMLAGKNVSALARGGADPLALERPLYRALFRDRLDPGSVEALRGATNGGWALGDRRFQRAIAQAVGRRAAPLPKGRKPKADKYRRRPDLF